MKSRPFFLTLAVSASLLAGCGSSKAPSPGPTIHLGGGSAIQNFEAVYWRDALGATERPNPVVLDSEGFNTLSTSMAVKDDGTIYIAGRADAADSDWSQPVVWRNGELQFLPLGPWADEFKYHDALGIALAGDTVHVVGTITLADSGVQAPAHWVNGELPNFLPLPESATSGLLTGVTVTEGGDVYAVGIVDEGMGLAQANAAYWKNGARTDLVIPPRNDVDFRDAGTTFVDIAIDDNDVFVLATISDYRIITDAWPQDQGPMAMVNDCIPKIALMSRGSCPWLPKAAEEDTTIIKSAADSDQDIFYELVSSTPLVWKNGVPMWVQPMVDNQYLRATGLAIHNGQIWVTGVVGVPSASAYEMPVGVRLIYLDLCQVEMTDEPDQQQYSAHTRGPAACRTGGAGVA